MRIEDPDEIGLRWIYLWE